MPGARVAGDPSTYPLFLFCGILPWTWFSSSLLESCTALTGSGSLLRKVMFPAEILPAVTVFTGLVNFCFGLVILAAFSIYMGVPILTPDLAWLPLIVLVQLVLTLGLALLLSSLSVHFRDIRDLLGNLMTLWFFATPIIYPYSQAPERFRRLLDLNPFTHLAVAYQEVLYLDGPFAAARGWLSLGWSALVAADRGLRRLRSAARDASRRKCERRAAVEVRDVHKLYRRYGRRKNFGTLKSALLSGRLLADLRPDQYVRGAEGRVASTLPPGRTLGIVGRNGSGKSTLLKLIAGIGRPTSGTIDVRGRVSALIELGAGFHPEISGRENVFINGMMLGLSKREVAARFDDIVALRRDRRVHRRAGEDVFVRHVHAARLRRGDARRPGRAAGGRSAGRRRRGVHAQVPGPFRRAEAPAEDDRAGDAHARSGDAAVRRGAVARRTAACAPRATPSAWWTPTCWTWRRAKMPAPGVAAQRRRRRPATTPEDMTTAAEGRWGSREAEITRVEMRHANGAAGHVFQSGEPVDIVLGVQAARELTDFVFGVGVYSADGVCCYGTNTHIEGARPQRLAGSGRGGRSGSTPWI